MASKSPANHVVSLKSGVIMDYQNVDDVMLGV
jgi:hypothetical protein